MWKRRATDEGEEKVTRIGEGRKIHRVKPAPEKGT